MLEREATDVLLSALAAMIMFQLQLSPTKGTFMLVSTYSCALIILLNFLHLILRQLNRITDGGSKALVLVNAVLVISTLFSVYLASPEETSGFWSGVSNGYILVIYLVIAVQAVLVAISLNAKLLNS